MYGINWTKAQGCKAAQGCNNILSARDVTILYPVGISYHGYWKEEETTTHLARNSLRLLSCSLSQLSNVDRSLEHLVTEGCGQISRY